MHIALERQILCNRKRNLRRDQTFHHRIVGQVKEHAHMIRNAALVKCLAEELCNVMLNTHRAEHNREVLVRPVAQGRLLNDLRRQLVVGKSVSREDRKLLPADHR